MTTFQSLMDALGDEDAADLGETYDTDGLGGEPLPDTLPAHLRRLLDEAPSGDRSDQTYCLIACALEAGLTDGQAVTLAGRHSPTLEKYGPPSAEKPGRLEREVARLLGKLRPGHPHAGRACDRASCANTPDWMSKRENSQPPRGAPAPTPGEVAEFWESRDVLAHLQTFARARMVSPWALLGTCVARVLCQVPPHVVLPPLVGGVGSLNTFVALVGRSGAGKGASESAAGDAVPLGDIFTAGAGSGEGINHLYVRWNGRAKVVEQLRDSVLLSIPEVDKLTALGARQGATLTPALRSAFMGESLTFAYADPEKALPVPAHSYRLCLLLGVQPTRAEVLLKEAEGGTPQRFLWLPATDPDAPDIEPAEPHGWRIPAFEWSVNTGRWHRLSIPDDARQTLVANRRATLRGQAAALDGHALFVRLKLAQGLALLDCRQVMNEGDWRLSGVVMRVSDATRESVQRELAERSREANDARGVMEGQRAAIAENVAAEQAAARVARSIRKRLSVEGEAASDVRRRLPARDRRYYDDAVERLTQVGDVERMATDHGERLRLVVK